jgi:hypothetical protein
MSTYDNVRVSAEVVLCSFVAPPPPLCLGVRENALVSLDYCRVDEPWLRWQVDRIDDNGSIAIRVSGQPRALVAGMSDGSLSLREKSGQGALNYATDEIWNVVTPDFSANARRRLEEAVGATFLIPFLLGGTQQPGVQIGRVLAVRPDFDYGRNLNILGNGPRPRRHRCGLGRLGRRRSQRSLVLLDSRRARVDGCVARREHDDGAWCGVLQRLVRTRSGSALRDPRAGCGS